MKAISFRSLCQLENEYDREKGVSSAASCAFYKIKNSGKRGNASAYVKYSHFRYVMKHLLHVNVRSFVLTWNILDFAKTVALFPPPPPLKRERE